MMFSSAFSSAFVRPAVESGEFIGPMSAQAALVDGAAVVLSGAGLLIGGKKLIGPAGKVFAFKSAESAAVWVANAAAAGLREQDLIAHIDPVTAAEWKVKKRKKLAVIAGRLVDAAARQSDVAKRAALLAESDYCLSKWA
jgi:hypothetical protein